MHMQVKPASVQTILARYYMRFIAFSWKLSFDLSRATSRPCTQINSVNDDCSGRSMQVALHLWHKDQWEASQVPCLVVDMHWLHAVGHTLPWRWTSLWWWRGAQNTNTQFSMCPSLHSMLQGDLRFSIQQMWVRAGAEWWENMLSNSSPWTLPRSKEQWIVFLDSFSFLKAGNIFALNETCSA